MNDKHNIGSLFDRIASKYDFLNHLLSLNIDKLWRKKAIKSIVKHKDFDYQCLDVAIGTGDLAIELASQLNKNHATYNITGIDLSAEMMRIGEEKVKKFAFLKGAKKIPRVKPNGESYYYTEGSMPFPDKSS